MKRFIKMLVIISTVLSLAGCGGKSASENSEPDNISPTSGTVSLPPISVPIDELKAVQINYEIFQGLPKSEKRVNTVNRKDFCPSLLCFGDDSVFFMWNGAVYRHNGETTEKLFEKNAYDLNYYDGVLYFIENDRYDLNSIDRVKIDGILYRYDLNGGTIEALTDYPVSLPAVSSDGIFYTDYRYADDPSGTLTGICRIAESGVPERLYDGVKYLEYGGCRLKFDWSGEEKVYFSCGDERLLLENVHPHNDCIVGDYYYYRSQEDNSLNRLSILSGELETLPNNTENGFVCQDHTVLNDEVYLIDHQSALRKYSFDTGDYSGIDCEYALRYIYADEKNLYGVGCKREESSIKHTLHFIKLYLNGDTAESEILA